MEFTACPEAGRRWVDAGWLTYGARRLVYLVWTSAVSVSWMGPVVALHGGPLVTLSALSRGLLHFARQLPALYWLSNPAFLSSAAFPASSPHQSSRMRAP